MQYILKNKDIDVLCFEVQLADSTNLSTIRVRIINVFNEALLPMGIKRQSLDSVSLDEALLTWIKARKIPHHRENAPYIVATYSDYGNEGVMDYIHAGFGLGLNDSYWIMPIESTPNMTKHEFMSSAHTPARWKDVNLYENGFLESVERAAFGLFAKRLQPISLSPEYTTNGMLKKCWHRSKDRICLYKASSKMFSIGGEAYSEYYMAQIARVLGFNAISYDLQMFYDEVVSVCEIFTSQDEGYVPMAQCLNARERKMRKNSQNNVIEHILRLYDKAAFEDLMLFDAIIYNADRHLGNFGMIVDNNTGALLRPAPIFDNGLSLIATLEEAYLNDIDTALARDKSYFDIPFTEQMRLYVQERHLEHLTKLCHFEFTKHPKYNLADSILEPINKHLQRRARQAIALCEEKQ